MVLRIKHVFLLYLSAFSMTLLSAQSSGATQEKVLLGATLKDNPLLNFSAIALMQFKKDFEEGSPGSEKKKLEHELLGFHATRDENGNIKVSLYEVLGDLQMREIPYVCKEDSDSGLISCSQDKGGIREHSYPTEKIKFSPEQFVQATEGALYNFKILSEKQNAPQLVEVKFWREKLSLNGLSKDYIKVRLGWTYLEGTETKKDFKFLMWEDCQHPLNSYRDLPLGVVPCHRSPMMFLKEPGKAP